MTSNGTHSLRSPLSIYVVFHPESKEARDLAKTLHSWFRLKYDSGDGTEAGLPVWYRAAVEGKSDTEARIRPELRLDDADRNAVILLVDDVLVADKRWRYALEKLSRRFAPKNGTRPTDRILLPVELSPSLYRLPYVVEDWNPIRVGHEATPGDRARALRRAVTEAIVRELRDRKGEDGLLPERLTVFLSHAKADGATIAETLRDGLARSGQLRTWYDANDLPPGYGWRSPMEGAAEKNSAALICVVTDAYPSRYWCRREVNLARRPSRADRNSSSLPFSAWTVQPTVAVNRAGSGWSRPMPQLAQVPRVGWTEGDGTDQRMTEVVDRLLLETMLIGYYLSWARRLVEYLQRSPEKVEPGTAIACTTWVPEPWSLVHLISDVLETGGNNGIQKVIVAYPGVGLATAERSELEDLVDSLQVTRKHGRVEIELDTQERLLGRAERLEGARLGADRSTHPHFEIDICLSGGGEDAELLGVGTGIEQVEDVLVRLARRFLEAGSRIVYGGTLAELHSNLTEALVETANGWFRDRDVTPDEARSATAADLDRPPFVNYSAWPNDKRVTTAHHARLAGICRFDVVLPPNPDDRPLPDRDTFDVEDAEHTAWAADALTAMRKLSSRTTKMRVVLAGKVFGALGWLPGIAEEVLCSLEEGRLTLIVRGFGGCSDVLAEYLRDPKAPWPAELTFEQQGPKGSPHLNTRPAEALKRFVGLEEALREYRATLHGEAPWPHPPATRRIALRLVGSGSDRPLGIAELIEQVSRAAQLVAGTPPFAE